MKTGDIQLQFSDEGLSGTVVIHGVLRTIPITVTAHDSRVSLG